LPLLRASLCSADESEPTLTAPVGRPIAAGDHLYLIDGSGFLFRAYHALPPLTRTADGLPVNAVSGYCNMLWKLLEEMNGPDAPTHLAVVFDAGRKTFRNEIYSAYKANRPEPPEDLIPQFPLVREATRAFSVSCVEAPGYEADDLIAAYARQATDAGAHVTIVSSDKDLMQLVADGRVRLYDAMKNKPIGVAEVLEKFGVSPAKVPEVQALAGDSTDNVPGVPGIGIKTAAELIRTYGDLETLLLRANEIKQPKRRETLMNGAEAARISLKLVRLDDEAPLPAPIDDFAVRPLEPDTVLGFLKDMEFAALARRIAAKIWRERETEIAPPEETAPQVAATIDVTAYETVATLDRLDEWILAARRNGAIAVDCETTSLDAMRAELVGVSLALEPGKACYIPCGHHAGDGFAFEGSGIAQLGEAELLVRLKPLFEDETVLKIGQNIKYDNLIFLNRGVRIAPIDDTMLMSYVLEAGLHGHGMDELSEMHLGHKPIAFADVAGRGKDKVTFDRVPIREATAYAAEDADVTMRLWHVLKPQLTEQHLRTVYETLERPMVPVLVDMERTGITVDCALLRRLSNDFALAQGALEKEITALAGQTFNIASPKQLGEILFDRMSLPGGKRTKTGAWSTDADALEELAASGHELPIKVLAWRGLAKLRGTYTDALPEHVNPKTGRVHTSYAMSAAATGRLASTDPNLQNIPVRTQEGRRIRQAFVAPPGAKLISADYSQIELRLLAHIADIAALKQSFADGIDIHAMTASEIFGVPVKDMPSEVRRRAKAINFGIVYGISAFGLANQLGIPRSDADDYIKRYFKRFPGIRDYMEATKTFARTHGYVETLFGRRIHIREINSKNAGLRGGAERAAINAPVQGSAADIIRRAMVRMSGALASNGLAAKMLLQVHDELVFESPEAEVDKTCAVAKAIMENAALPAVKLDVALTVDARAADNWDAAH